MIDYFV